MKPFSILKDPRIVAGGVALLWILFDQLPTDFYSTFADPGAAMVLSVLFAEFLALAVVRRWDKLSSGWLIGAAAFKLFGQGFFYIRDASPVDTAFLFSMHLLVAALAGREWNISAVAMRCSLAMAGCVGGYAVSAGAFFWPGNLEHREGYAWAFATARVAFPFCFWTALRFVPRWAGRWNEYLLLEPDPESAARERARTLRLLAAVTIFAGLGFRSFWAKQDHRAELAVYLRFAGLRAGLSRYAEENAGKFPLTWDEFARASLPASDWRFHDRHTGEEIDWIYFGGHTKDEQSSQSHASTMIMAAPRLILNKRAVIYADTSAGLLSEDNFVRELSGQTANPDHR